MKSILRLALFSLILGTAFTMSGQSFAQSTRDMQYLTKEERADFAKRLQQAGVTSQRSKVTAEMNRTIQKRRLEQRRLEREQKAAQPE